MTPLRSKKMAKPKQHGRTTKSRVSCCVPLCNKPGYVTENDHKITFHKFPKNNIGSKKMYADWLVKIKRDEGAHFQITEHTRVCSRHFKPCDFYITPKGRKFVKAGVVPSIFPFQKQVESRAKNMWQKNCVHESLPQFPASATNETLVGECSSMSSSVGQNGQVSNTKQRAIVMLEQQLANERRKCEILRKERDHVRDVLGQTLDKLNKSTGNFCIEKFQKIDSDVCFYTGFPTFNTMEACYKLLNPEGNLYYRGTSGQRKRLGSTKLSYKKQFFLTMVRLRLGLMEKDLADRFSLSQSTVHRYCHAWITFMYLRLGSLNIWPTQGVIRRTMPESMKSKFANLEWIIDAFEVQTQRPASLMLQSQSYSSYKSRNTVKGLVACTPSGQIGFVSQLYTGNISDRELVIRSGFLDMPHNQGAVWLVDKGFQIQDLADKLGVIVNMPAFVGSKGQLTAAEVFHTQSVASERIHIERAINKIKKFHLFDRPVPISTMGTVNQAWSVAALLTLFQKPIISA